MRQYTVIPLIAAVFLAFMGAYEHTAAQDIRKVSGDFTGRWDATVYAPAGVYPSWFELSAQDDGLTGRYVGRFGSARPIDAVSASGSDIRIVIEPQYESRDDNLIFDGSLFEDGVIRGSFLDEHGDWVYFAATPAPELPANPSVSWGDPVELLEDGLDSNWHTRQEDAEEGWSIEGGMLANHPPTVDLISNREFGDFKLHLEYTMEDGSNSGVYLRGRYEVQLLDSFGNAPDELENAAVYGFVAPSRQTIKPAGQWNELDITLTGRVLTVVLNGAMVIDDYEIPGITGGALSSDETAPGPLMLQGDHGPVKFRNIIVWPGK